jgi:hypothetical protein
MWGAFSDEGTGLSFSTAAGPRQRSHFRVRVPWYSWPYFTVFDTASKRDSNSASTIITELLVLIIQPRHKPHRKLFFHYCTFSRCRGNKVSTELFPWYSCCTVACLHSCYLAMGLHVTIYTSPLSLKTGDKVILLSWFTFRRFPGRHPCHFIQ